MQITRRSLLAGILGAAVAPAVVKASSLMKIYVPSTELMLPGEKLVLQDAYWTEDPSFPRKLMTFEGDFTIEGWLTHSSPTAVWRTKTTVHTGNDIKEYADGFKVSSRMSDKLVTRLR